MPTDRPAVSDKQVEINQGQPISQFVAEQSEGEEPQDFIPPRRELPEIQRRENPEQQQRQALQQIQAQQLIRQLRVRDREVRAHEAAHAAAGADLTGAPSFTYQQGPDGNSYAIGGEVAINTSRIQGDAAATLARAEKVRRAALAPVTPSAQDMHIATMASRMAVEARAAIAAQQSRDLAEQAQGKVSEEGVEADAGAAVPLADSDDSADSVATTTLSSSPGQQQIATDSGLNDYRATASLTATQGLGQRIEQNI